MQCIHSGVRCVLLLFAFARQCSGSHIFNPFSARTDLGVRRTVYSQSDVYRRQILTCKVDTALEEQNIYNGRTSINEVERAKRKELTMIFMLISN